MKGKTKKILWISLAMVLVIGMVAGFALPGLAAASDSETQALALAGAVKGTVSAKTADTFTVNIGGSQSVMLKVDSSTKFYQVTTPVKLPPQPQTQVPPAKSIGTANGMMKGMGVKNGLMKRVQTQAQVDADEFEAIANGILHGDGRGLKNWMARINWVRRFGKEATFADIVVGDTVWVKVKPNDNLAQVVLIVKKPTIGRISGKVSAVTANSITITPTTGAAATLSVDATTRLVIIGATTVQLEQPATAIYNTETNKAVLVTVGTPPIRQAPVQSASPTPTGTSV